MNRDDSVPDGEVIRRSIDDPDAFEVIFERHFDAIYRYLARRGGRFAGESVASDTFCAAFDQRDRFDASRGDARAWLYGIATNLLHRHWRSEGRRRRLHARFRRDRSMEREPATPDVRDGTLDGDVRAALAALHDGERDVLLLYAWGELSYREIAEALEIPVGTVQSRLHRARAHMRRRLAPATDPAGRTALTVKESTDG